MASTVNDTAVPGQPADWPIDSNVRADVVRRMHSIVRNNSAKRREAVSASKALMQADAINAKRQAAASGGHPAAISIENVFAAQFNGSATAIGQEAVRRAILADVEYLAYRERQLLDACGAVDSDSPFRNAIESRP